MTRDVLLVGSVGLNSAEDVFRSVGSILSMHVNRIPDGETGWARSVWTQCQRPYFLGNPALEMVEKGPDGYVPARVPAAGIYGHTLAETYRGRARLRQGTSPTDVAFDNLGYADWAEESYASFARLKRDGVLPEHVRFQVCVPDPAIILNMHVWPEAQAVVGPVYAVALFGEIQRLARLIPPAELAIQWDCTQPVAYESADADGRRAIVNEMARLSARVPVGVELGYHLCYGDFEHKHGIQPPNLQACVEITNGIIQEASRTVDWVHMPVPRERDDAAYVASLCDLRLPPSTRLYLGLVHYTDGIAGTRRRMASAASVYPDFGIATECGLGRRVGQDIHKLLRIHAEAAELAEVSVFRS
jgi:hypothetical protein